MLLEADEDGGIDLALRGDAFLVQMESEAAANETVDDEGRCEPLAPGAGGRALVRARRGRGADADARAGSAGTTAATRRREPGSRWAGASRYTDAGSRLTVEANARTLDRARGLRITEEWGAGGSVRLGPGASGRGLSLTLAPVWGTPSSGVERLWSARDAAGLVRDDDFDAERRLEGEIGYGFGAPRGLGLATPYAGLSLAGGGRAWRLGARWNVAPDVTFGLEGTRRESGNDDEPPQHGLMLRGVLRW